LRLWDGQRLSALEEHSKLVHTLTHQEPWAWLVVPKQVEEALESFLP
jgi:hypothetical protein